jgi:stage II sporulation protein D
VSKWTLLLATLLVTGALAPLQAQEFRVELFSGKRVSALTLTAGAEPVQICDARGKPHCLVLKPRETARCLASPARLRCMCDEKAEEFRTGSFTSSAPFRLAIALAGPRESDSHPSVTLRAAEVSGNRSRFRVIAPVDLETYVGGVVAGEAATLKSPAALAAMAILARTWALRSRGRHQAQGFDFCSLTHCQFFRLPSETGSEPSPIAEAVAGTTGLVLKYRGELIDAYYCAHCGGVTEAAGDVWPDRAAPYLRSVSDPYCTRSAQAFWQQALPLETVRGILSTRLGVRLDGPLRALEVAQKSTSGRVRSLRLVGSSTRQIDANEFRYAVNRQLGWNTLKSNLYTLEQREGRLIFTGRGLGHGVGLCQVGAEQMGQMGLAYEKILVHYFPGTTVEELGASRAERILSSEHFELVFPPSQELWVQETLQTLEESRRGLESRARALPAKVRVRTWETTAEFMRASGQPGWVAASNDGRTIQLQPLSTLKRKGILNATLRHELTHLVVHRLRAPQVPHWFEEGLVLLLTGEQPAAGAASSFSGRSLEESVSHPRSEAEMTAAYARALARVRELARQRGASALWEVLQHPSADDLRWFAGQR